MALVLASPSPRPRRPSRRCLRMLKTRMLPGLLRIILALAAVAGSSPTEPSTIGCPKINATLSCNCRSHHVTCNGLGLSDLSFLARFVSDIEILFVSYNDLRELPAYCLSGATNISGLTLSHNKIASISGRFFESLPSLVFLDLSHNELTEFYLQQKELPNLEILNLTNNFLSHLRFDGGRPPNDNRHSIISRNNICGLNNNVLQYNGLEQLYLSHNKIENDLHFLHNLTKLKILTLGFNNISKIDSNVFPYEDELRCLHINNNRLSDLAFLQYIGILDTLNVSNNEISTIADNTFKHLTLLQNLIIANNKIADSRFLYNVSSNTIFLDLSSNKLSHIPVNTMMNKYVLKYVDISYNELRDISFVSYLENLEVLFANNNKIFQIDRQFSKLPRNTIKKLSLNNNFISDIGFLKYLRNITSLSLNNNEIYDIKEDSMSQLNKLAKLDLSNNRIKNVKFVKNVPSLNFLNLSNNYVTQLPCNNFVRSVSLDGNDLESLTLNCVPKLQYLYIHGGFFRDRKKQELGISKDILLDINNMTNIEFSCFPPLNVILKCKEMYCPTKSYEICETQGSIFSSPIAIVVYCISALLCLLVIAFIITKCLQLRRRVDRNRQCLCGKVETAHRHHTFTRNRLC